MRRRRKDRQIQYDSAAYADLQARIAANARRLRDDLGWTQEEAAQYTEMSTRLYQRIEGADSNLTLTTLARLASGFQVDAAELLRSVSTTSKKKQKK